jgi:hypothetical protein
MLLPFFPASLPDEILISRVSRHHIVEGNSAVPTTLEQLFGRTQTELGHVVPRGIDTLAGRLPGETVENLRVLTSANTLLPLFSPFIGKAGSPCELESKDVDTLVSRLPRRVVGQHGDSSLCIQCVLDDERDHGIAYWHRSHQAPGVAACWRHRVRLISSCPTCDLPFQRKLKLLDIPWKNCPQCRTDIRNALPDRVVSDVEYSFSVFVHHLLHAELPPIPADILALTYRTAIKSRGFSRGSLPAVGEFTEAMISTLSEDFIRQVDPAYSSGRTKFWIRFSICDDAIDMPITRHLLLSMHLFGTPKSFMAAVAEATANVPEQPGAANKVARSSNPSPTRAEHRKRVRSEILRDPSLNMQKLWRRAFTATAWLFENDRRWLETTVRSAASPPAASEPVEQVLRDEDKKYADLVEATARAGVLCKSKPQRLTLERLLAPIPKKGIADIRQRERYPLLSEQILLCKESSWSFSARRILWALGELNRLDLSIVVGNICRISAVSYYAINKIAKFAQWDFEDLATRPLNVAFELSKAGIGLTWAGPDSTPMGSVAGRAYVRRAERGRINDFVATE